MMDERRAEMRESNLETYVIDRFILSLREQGKQWINPPIRKPVLYLKCWGSDYPYLQGLEQQKRWLPVPVDSTPGF
jgi:hypothetical protein